MNECVFKPGTRASEKAVVAAVGFFDGVHLGHLAVLGGARARADAIGAEAWAVTFSCHPRAVFGDAPPLLTPIGERLELFAKAGVENALILTFDRAMAAMAPEAFAEALQDAFPRLAEVRCGANWRFGAQAAGTPGLLAAIGARRGFAVSVAPDALHDGRPVSSTRIRGAVADGDMAAAAAMLGRPYSIRGTVGKGRRVGSAGGFATANFLPKDRLLPPEGVYAVRSEIDGRAVAGVADLGWRPTFADARPESPILEVHYIDFEGDLYGRQLDVGFLKRIRGERKFDTPEALFAQIGRDVEAAKKELRDKSVFGRIF